MSKYWAKIVDGLVVNVIVANEDFFDTFVDDTPGTWLETKMDGSIRKNYAGIGHTYDQGRDAFYEPQPYPSWILNEDTCTWEASKPMPTDSQSYLWNEANKNWDVKE